MNASSKELSPKVQRTREALRSVAMHLFLTQGYEETTVAQIAAAAQVSQMTFFRHFPTKDAAILSDDYDPVIVEVIRQQPTTLAPLRRIHAGIQVGLAAIYAESREGLLARSRLVLTTPALRAQLADSLAASQRTLEAALAPGSDHGHGAPPLSTRAVAAAASATLTAAVEQWVAEPEQGELPDLIDAAFSALYAACESAETGERDSTASPPTSLGVGTARHIAYRVSS